MTRATFDPMDDERFDRELRRFLHSDVRQIKGAPSRDEMIERVAPAAQARHRPPWASPATPTFRLVLILGLIAALLVGAFAAGVWRNPDRPLVIAPTPTASPTPRLLEGHVLAAGSWFVDVGAVRITLDVPDDGWEHGRSGGLNWLRPLGERPALLLMTEVTNVLATPCGIPHSPAIGPSVVDLVTALTELGLGSSAPVDATVDGYRGKRLRMVAPPSLEGCTDQINVWTNARASTPSYLDYGEQTDIWVLDVAGTRLVLRTMVLPDTTPQERAATRAMFESIQLEALAPSPSPSPSAS